MRLNLEFDPDELQSRYAEERRKRLRADGNDQYQEVAGEFSRFGDDPNATPDFTREPIVRDIECLLIGGGLGALLTAATLRKAGVTDMHVIDKAADFGGTWYWNRYPGVQCDIESYIYLPLLEDVGYKPKRKYAFGSEILAHAQNLARYLGLYDNAIFQTSVTGMEWNDEAQRWAVSTDRGDRINARFVVMATGPLDRPKLPAIPGITTFKGHTFHTSRWDYAYTGGGERGGLTGLADKKVAIIGTGSTAIQCISYVAQSAERLYVFQRTPAAVDVRNDQLTDMDWMDALPRGWQAERIRNFTAVIDGGGADEDLVNDGWTAMYQDLTALTEQHAAKQDGHELSRKERAKLMSLADMRTMERIRARIGATVADPGTAEKLKPWYGRWCKRPQFHDEYYPVFNRPNVTLVDTEGRGVERVTERGLVFGGQEFEVDCIIFATGYEVGTDYTRRAQYDIVGRGGITLSKKWADGMRTVHGMLTSGFPNCFFLGQTQTGITANYCHTVREQADHLAYVIEQMREQNALSAEATEEAEERYVNHFREVGISNSSYYRNCTPGFFTNEGQLGDNTKGFLATFYGPGPLAFFDMLAGWRRQGNLDGLRMKGAVESVGDVQAQGPPSEPEAIFDPVLIKRLADPVELAAFGELAVPPVGP
jgi:cation diffusion facilitator CzcD-associated flavoprotein CzcO